MEYVLLIINKLNLALGIVWFYCLAFCIELNRDEGDANLIIHIAPSCLCSLQPQTYSLDYTQCYCLLCLCSLCSSVQFSPFLSYCLLALSVSVQVSHLGPSLLPVFPPLPCCHIIGDLSLSFIWCVFLSSYWAPARNYQFLFSILILWLSCAVPGKQQMFITYLMNI